MGIKQRRQAITKADFEEAIDYLGSSISEVAKEAEIPRSYLSDLKNRDVPLRREHNDKLRAYFEMKGVEFEASDSSRDGDPLSRSAGGIAIAGFVSDDLPNTTVSAIQSRRAWIERRVGKILEQPAEYEYTVMFPKKLVEDLKLRSKKLYLELIELLVEDALLCRRLEGRCLLPPLPAKVAEGEPPATTQGEVLALRFSHLSEGDLALEPEEGDEEEDTDDANADTDDESSSDEESEIEPDHA